MACVKVRISRLIFPVPDNPVNFTHLNGGFILRELQIVLSDLVSPHPGLYSDNVSQVRVEVVPPIFQLFSDQVASPQTLK